MQKITFTAIGDVGVDVYPELQKQFAGGTALNSAIHAQRAGSEASVMSVVGTDKEASIITQKLQSERVNTSQLAMLPGETDRVDITLDEKGRPQYSNWELGTLENYVLSPAQKQFLASQDIAVAVHLPEIKPLFDSFAEMKLASTIKVADFTDLSEYARFENVISHYESHFDVLALSIDSQIKEKLDLLKSIATKKHKMTIALLGEKGSQVFYRSQMFVEKPSQIIKPLDTTGAGDAYLATFLVKHFQNKDIQSAMKQATTTAEKVIQKVGAV